MNEPLQPASIAFGPDGTPVADAFGDVYHSADGGPGQARHVFLHGNDLPQRWQGRERFVILENGFGTGLNFLATWAAWRADPRRPGRLHYLAVEKHPIRTRDLARLHARWPEFGGIAEALRHAWPVLTPGFHRLEFAAGRVVLSLLLGDAASSLRRLQASVDAFYLDGFAPQKNPDMWSPALFGRCAQLAAADATLATWCVAGAVRAALHDAGFDTAKRPGFGHKREMLVGWPAKPHAPASPTPAQRHAVIIGAGLAGCAAAERLAARGWLVHLLDRHAAPAGEASGNLAGVVRPLLSRDDNIASRLNRACFLHAARAWGRLDRAGHPPRRNLNGVIQIGRDASHETRQRELVALGGYPHDYVQFLEREAAGKVLGVEPAFGGWWFPGGGWANPPGLCRAWLAAGGMNIDFRGGADVSRLERSDGAWHLLDASGRLLAESANVILASGAQLQCLAQAAGLPLSRVRGQVSHIPGNALPRLEYAVCCEGYLTPAVDGMHCLGASYAYDAGAELRRTEHASNLKRLARMLPGAAGKLDPAELAGRVGFRAVTPDRLPLVGALPEPAAALAGDCRLADLPRQPGLYGLLGLGSRGLVWSALAAEALASRLEGDPMPLENDLLDAIDPGRFRLRAHRRGQG